MVKLKVFIVVPVENIYSITEWCTFYIWLKNFSPPKNLAKIDFLR